MKLKTLLKTSHPWLEKQAHPSSVVIATLGRLSRSLADHVFPGWSTPEARQAVLDELRPTIKNLTALKSAFHAELSDLDRHERKLLVERKLISPCMAARGDGSEVFIPKNQKLSVMLNEEEHLVIHSFSEGYKIPQLRKSLEKMAEQIEETHIFAKNQQGEYLSSIPAECGNGLQMYLVMHLPGLVISNLMKEIRNAFEKLGLQISPFYSDEHHDTHDLFVIYTTPKSSAQSEQDLETLRRVCETLIRREMQVRNKLINLRPLELRDQVTRALGRLLYATTLSFTEMSNALSLLILGMHYQFLSFESMDVGGASAILRRMNTTYAPAHFAERMGLRVGEKDSRQVMALRAQCIQAELNKLQININSIENSLSQASV